MDNLNQNPGFLKEKEYEEIQNRATRMGHLENIHTHVSKDIQTIMNNPGRTVQKDNNDTNPGMVKGEDGIFYGS